MFFKRFFLFGPFWHFIYKRNFLKWIDKIWGCRGLFTSHGIIVKRENQRLSHVSRSLPCHLAIEWAKLSFSRGRTAHFQKNSTITVLKIDSLHNFSPIFSLQLNIARFLKFWFQFFYIYSLRPKILFTLPRLISSVETGGVCPNPGLVIPSPCAEIGKY